MSGPAYCAVYDFELMPYALGDVLTWNVQTAIRCEQAGRDRVAVFVCVDERHPASLYQQGVVTADNCSLFFDELSGAFGTHPRIESLCIFRDREALLDQLRDFAIQDSPNAAVLQEYEEAVRNLRNDDAVMANFTRQLHSHDRINAYARQRGRVPCLRASPGCEVPVAELVAQRFRDKRVVTVHMRLRRLDAGLGGERTYRRDSDFLDWYEFLAQAATTHPDVVFVALGRLQEKPLEFLELPNVTSLRILGLGLGHELTMMLRSELFIGTSSGFAAMANFSDIPYFITNLTAQSYRAYGIEERAERLPFALERQRLVHETETSELLSSLLQRGLNGQPPAAELATGHRG